MSQQCPGGQQGQAGPGVGEGGDCPALLWGSLTSSAGAILSTIISKTSSCWRMSMRLVRSVERKLYEAQLRALGLLSLEEAQVRPPWAPPHPPEEQQKGRSRSLPSHDRDMA